ncbi:MAG: hypothetical protein JXB17_08120 [Bacteroidales bacterium]|nr:hypothetical protein [Bacteroidales bacterium]
MKILKTSILSAIIFFGTVNSFLCSNLYGQDNVEEGLSKQEIKLQKLEEKVDKYKLKIESINIKIAQADSLIDAGIKMEAEAKAEMINIENEEKAFIKSQNTQLKELGKKRKKAAPEEANEIDAEIKVLDTEYKNTIRNIDKRYSEQMKLLDKGIASQDKGNEKKKLLLPSLKEAQDLLYEAEAELENYKTEFGFK